MIRFRIRYSLDFPPLGSHLPFLMPQPAESASGFVCTCAWNERNAKFVAKQRKSSTSKLFRDTLAWQSSQQLLRALFCRWNDLEQDSVKAEKPPLTVISSQLRSFSSICANFQSIVDDRGGLRT